VWRVFDALGPSTATLLDGWTPHDLAARRAGLEWEGTAERYRAPPRAPTAQLRGQPGELILFLFGRKSAAQVEVIGPADPVAAVHRTRFGM
jgi:hypothetical protein